MKAITIWQPYATLIALGIKKEETRSWGTSYRGKILIHAAKRWDVDRAIGCQKAIDYLVDTLGVMFLEKLTPAQLRLANMTWQDTLGKGLAVATLSGVQKGHEPPTRGDAEFGLYGPDRFGWRMSNVQAIEPVSLTGKQGLWEVADSEIERGVFCG